MGLDCDDGNAELTNECLCEDRSSPGCGCEEEGARVACGTVYSRVGDQVICGQGIMTCDGSAWGQCVINNAVTLVAAPTSQLELQSLGSATPCEANPCDPGCQTFSDTPDNLDLPDESGVVSSPSGVTLPSSAAVVIPGITSTGFDCTNSAYPASGGTCGHHICKTGAALGEWCDGTAPYNTTLNLFSANFSSSTGWSTDTNWAIGSTSVSAGHTAAGPDPASDTTSGSDNRVGGTVLGGNIGGSVPVLTEAFGSLSNWDESGESDWRTQSRESSSGYSGSGNPVARADNCDTSCTITMDSTVNLSSYGSATLTFQYYLSENLDNGEFLRVEAHNGSSWSQILNLASEAADDSTWHTATVSLNSYVGVSNFRLRFVTTESETNEGVEIDDVSITGVPASVTHYLTSPAFNTSTASGNLTLSFRRWLNLNSDFVGKVEVYNGSSWTSVYTSSGTVNDTSWQSLSYDITPYKSASTRVRFSYSGASAAKVSGWNVDDISVTGLNAVAGTSLCVHDVCVQRPECCTTSWSIECVQLLDSACDVDCNVNTQNGNACVACFNDTSITVDVDGDGMSPATGDCKECEPGINPGAYDLPDNGIDENCDGLADNETTTCDATLFANGDAWSHAQALGLCKVASGNSWGVVSASFVKADGTTACTDTKQREIMSAYGTNTPTQGSKMSVFSSGTARSTSSSEYKAPDGIGYSLDSYEPYAAPTNPKYTVPSAAGCDSGKAGYDSCGLKLVIKAPTNAQSFGYNFNFFTSEYPEWLCTEFNDAYVAYYEGSMNTASNKNISFDSVGNPVSVNNGLFTVPGTWPPPSGGTNPKLNGTGFAGVCSNNPGGTWVKKSICGGATDWLKTTAPVAAGEQITLIFNIWDTGDPKWDSLVLLDNFTWSTSPASIETGHYIPNSDDTVLPPTYTDGWFTRDYDMTGVCADDEVPVWSLWSWSATTPSDSKIEFFVQSADSAAGLAAAPLDTLIFTDPPGPSALSGTAAVARAGSPNTEAGSAIVHDTLEENGRNTRAPHLRVSAHLVPSTDHLSAPLLGSWNLQTSCEQAQ